MRYGPALDHDSDFGGIELLFGIVVWVPVDFDGWQMLDRIVVSLFCEIFDRVFVYREETCDSPPEFWIYESANLSSRP